MSDQACSAPTCQPQDGFVCAQHRLAHLEREQAEDREAIRDYLSWLENVPTLCQIAPGSQAAKDFLDLVNRERRKHAAALARAQEGKG